ncbi:FxSxx-COOH system tetratricopeptide repeat protein [Streptomyces sp. H39-C1]|uniref:FxSxx-COOH system tetratricopeptide repeat protein n=1 Tax=Streptomyces sp. H39-C1 TaxID=3004355 RepID=UPI0022AFDFF8|nr:FxSxx-COOH system tetratricopeptide repeat protein [Streptomyces sp. H39-C1]MCZ4098057.1 FxSxx-COOH system tetratricopeptide repeat protein [Streptomyces sp. H39-C1]
MTLTQAATRILSGMGGVGKTQMAAAYARQAWELGVGLLVWVNAATRDGVVSAYADAALRLELPLADPADPEGAAREFLAWAETTTERWWLVVLDDVRGAGDLRSLWPAAGVSAAGGQVVVTTRLRDAALAGVDRTMVEVSTFTPTEARTYLHAKLASAVFDTDQADALAEELGYLPLALAQAATYIRNSDIECAAYRHLLAKRLLARTVPDEQNLPDDHERIVTAIWELSIDLADRAEPAGLARPVLSLASVLDPGGIPQIVLSSPPALDYLASYLLDPAPIAGLNAQVVDESLRVLHRHNLINHDRAAIHREVRVHQLVQRATRENLSAQPHQGPELFAALAETAADALLAVWPQTERDELVQMLQANTTAVHQAAGAALWNLDTGGHPVLFLAATSLGKAGQVTAAIAASAELHTAALEHLGPDHPDTLTARGNQANWLREVGDVMGAATAFEELLADQLRALGPDHPGTLITWGNLAHARGQLGDTAWALSTFAELLRAQLTLHGSEHRNTLTTRAHLASLRGRTGDAAGATAAIEELLTDQLRALGPDHPDTLSTRNSLATWRGRTGNPTGAVATLEELLGDQLRALGPDHPNTLINRSNLASMRGLAGDPDAVSRHEEVLVDFLRVLGPDHPQTLTAHNNLASVRGRTGDLEGAVAAFEDALARSVRVLGPGHPHTMGTRQILAYWRRAAGLE